VATILLFPSDKIAPACRLTRPECDAVRVLADELIRFGHVSSMSLHNDGQFISLYDRFGDAYTIGREDGICSAFDPDEVLIASGPHFDDVLEALDTALTRALPVELTYTEANRTA
jgi:hypothetical protein